MSTSPFSSLNLYHNLSLYNRLFYLLLSFYFLISLSIFCSLHIYHFSCFLPSRHVCLFQHFPPLFISILSLHLLLLYLIYTSNFLFLLLSSLIPLYILIYHLTFSLYLFINLSIFPMFNVLLHLSQFPVLDLSPFNYYHRSVFLYLIVHPVLYGCNNSNVCDICNNNILQNTKINCYLQIEVDKTLYLSVLS